MIKIVRRLPLSWLVIAQNLFILACLVAVFGVFLSGLREIKVNGPVFVRVMDAADLTADILPPPLYAIEAYLTAHRLAEMEPGEEANLFIDRLQKLRRDFDDRVTYWGPRELPEDVRRLLFNEVIPKGHKVFDLVESDFLPAFRAHDKSAIHRALSAIAAAYEIHRSAVDRLIIRSHAALDQARHDAVSTEHRALSATYIFMALALMAAVAGASLLFFGAARPLRHVAQTLDRLAKGESHFEADDTDGPGEIPMIWKAVVVLRRAVLDALHLKKTLDEMPVNVMVADPQSGVVTYINRATLATIEGLSQKDAVSSHVDLLDPAHKGQRSMLASTPNAPWHTRFKVGAEVLNLRVDAILGADGRYLAPMLTWELAGAQDNQAPALDHDRDPGVADAAAAMTAQRLGEAARLIADVASETNLLALKAAIAASEAEGGLSQDDAARYVALSEQSEKLVEAVGTYMKGKDR